LSAQDIEVLSSYRTQKMKRIKNPLLFLCGQGLTKLLRCDKMAAGVRSCTPEFYYTPQLAILSIVILHKVL
jgi:hypothetical protein